MDNIEQRLNSVFHALADPTRRAVIQRLGRGSATVSELAEPFDMALPSFMKHISVLEVSGLIWSNKKGRVRTCKIKPRQFLVAEAWLFEQRAMLDGRIEDLSRATSSPQIIVNIDVPELEAGIRFYTDGLGFKQRRTLFLGTVAELSAGATTVFLIEKAEDSRAHSTSNVTRSYLPHWTPIHLDVFVDNIELARAKAVAAGAEEAPVSEKEWGKLVSLRDPFGHGICLLQLSASGYDAVAD